MAANQVQEYCAAAAGLLVAARMGSLATVRAGVPYAALVTPAFGEDGNAILLLSDLSAHTKDLRENPACALLVAGAAAEANPQTAPRVAVRAVAQQTDDAELRRRYLATHPYAARYADFGDFNFWRLILKDAHYVGGFAAAADLEIAALQHEIKSALGEGSG
jgi:putative heme iron utilization protein